MLGSIGVIGRWDTYAYPRAVARVSRQNATAALLRHGEESTIILLGTPMS